MTVAEVVEALHLEVCSGKKGLGRDVRGGQSSDLLSDVLTRGSQDFIWITVHNHKNVISIASLKKLAAVIIVNGLKPTADSIQKSDADGIPILTTTMSAFETAGRLYTLIRTL